MPSTTEVVSVEYVCGFQGENDTHFRIPVDYNSVAEEDVELLNLLLDPQFEPDAQQTTKLEAILGKGNLSCPEHGRQNVGYSMVEKITYEATFTIEVDGQVTREDEGDDPLFDIDIEATIL